MKLAGNYFEWQARMAKEQLGRRVLEVGCGVGNFTQHLLDRELVLGIDIEDACVQRHLERFAGHANIRAQVMDVLDPGFLELARHQLDSVVMLNVLEHVSDDALALSHLHAVLPPGGKVVLIVPAFESAYGPIDANLGHYRRYSKVSLRSLIESQGFHPRALRYINSVGFVGWWVNAKILKKTEQSESQIKFFDSRIVPVLSRLEAAFEPPFGQSLFAVVEKH